MAMKKTRKLPGGVIYSYLRDIAFTAVISKGSFFSQKWYMVRGGTLAPLGDTHSPK